MSTIKALVNQHRRLADNTLATQRLNKKLSYRKQYVYGICSNSVTLKSRLGVTQGHWKWHHHSIDRTRASHGNYGAIGAIFDQ